MQPSSPHTTPPTPGPTHSGPPVNPELHYNAPQFHHDSAQLEQTHHPDYEFIMNPGQIPTRKLPIGGQSSLGRVGLVVGGIVLLFMIFTIVKGALGSGTSSLTSMINVAQNQQQLIHLATAANLQPGVATSTLNSATTIQASVTSAQKQLTGYLETNHQKVAAAQLNQKVSTATDAQLTAAASAGTYDKTYREVMQTTLTAYEHSLKQAYAQVKGPKGRALLNTDYNGAQLLVQQLNQ